MTLSAIATFVLPILAIIIFITFLRLWQGPQLPDRVIAMDLLTVLGTGFIVVYALVVDNPVFLDIALVLALISFLGTIAFAFYINHRH